MQKYHGYELIRTQDGTWRDLQGQHAAIQVYKTEIKTPYSLGLERERLETRLLRDLGEVLGIEEDAFTRDGIDRRAYSMHRPYLIGCQASKSWKLDRWYITLITREDFEGFPNAVRR